jgi:hypothetical protein
LEDIDIEDTGLFVAPLYENPSLPCPQHEPKKANFHGMEACNRVQGSYSYDVSDSLKAAPVFNAQFESSLWHVPPFCGPPGNLWSQRQTAAWPLVANQGWQLASQQDVQGNDKAPPVRRQQRNRTQKRHCVLLIASQLNELQHEDPETILIVRRIQRLGFESASILHEHYERYGPVAKVLLSNPHEKKAGASFRVRLRPSGIGYVQFETAEAAARALADGETHVVAGVEVNVRAFERRESFSSTQDASGDSDVNDQTEFPNGDIKDNANSKSAAGGSDGIDNQNDVSKTGSKKNNKIKTPSRAQLTKDGLRCP